MRFEGKPIALTSVYRVECFVDYEACDHVCEDHTGKNSVPCSDSHDSPPHCCECHTPLSSGLTEHGVEYVLDAARDLLKQGRKDYCQPWGGNNSEPTFYYHGTVQAQVVLDWLEGIEDQNPKARKYREAIFRGIRKEGIEVK